MSSTTALGSARVSSGRRSKSRPGTSRPLQCARPEQGVNGGSEEYRPSQPSFLGATTSNVDPMAYTLSQKDEAKSSATAAVVTLQGAHPRLGRATYKSTPSTSSTMCPFLLCILTGRQQDGLARMQHGGVLLCLCPLPAFVRLCRQGKLLALTLTFSSAGQG